MRLKLLRFPHSHASNAPMIRLAITSASVSGWNNASKNLRRYSSIEVDESSASSLSSDAAPAGSAVGDGEGVWVV